LADSTGILICSTEFTDEIKSCFKNKILVDTSGRIEKLNLQTQDIAIIKTENKKIISIINPTPDNIMMLLIKK